MSDDLIGRARDRAETAPTHSQLGYRVAVDENEHFSGRWRGETADPDNEDRRVYLLWDVNGQRCFSRTYTALARELKKASPQIGDTIVLYRGTDYLGKGGNRDIRSGSRRSRTPSRSPTTATRT